MSRPLRSGPLGFPDFAALELAADSSKEQQMAGKQLSPKVSVSR
jgi:hypothetical protein